MLTPLFKICRIFSRSTVRTIITLVLLHPGSQAHAIHAVSDHLARRVSKLLKTLTIFQQNALDELKLIVGECAPKTGAARAAELCNLRNIAPSKTIRQRSYLCRL